MQSFSLGFFPRVSGWKIEAHPLPQGEYLYVLGCQSSGGAGRMESKQALVCCERPGQDEWQEIREHLTLLQLVP